MSIPNPPLETVTLQEEQYNAIKSPRTLDFLIQCRQSPLVLVPKLHLLRVVVHKIQTFTGQRTSPILLKLGMQSSFRVLTTKWMLKVPIVFALENIEKAGLE